MIEPTAVRLHKWGVLELAAWLSVSLLLLDSHVLFHPETGAKLIK